DELIGTGTFSEDVTGGEIGYGAWRANTSFANFSVSEIAPSPSAIDSVFGEITSDGSGVLI
ncbi:MAG: hypothetical protein CMJ46_16470, partial [Planctomyces sp.]|nr:hypothetical protein [Planctomyces sp.]